MNKFKSILVLLLASPLFVLSQVEFGGGVKFGAITSQVHGDSYAGFNKIGLSGGFFTDMNFGGASTVLFEILYSQKGSRNNPNTANGDFSFFKLELNYIEIPVTYSHEIGGVDIRAGLYYGYLMNSSQDTGSGEGSVSPPFRKYDIGGHIGAAYDFTEDKAFIELRLSNSIISTRGAPASSSIPGLGYDGGGYNTAIQLFLGYKF